MFQPEGQKRLSDADTQQRLKKIQLKRIVVANITSSVKEKKLEMKRGRLLQHNIDLKNVFNSPVGYLKRFKLMVLP